MLPLEGVRIIDLSGHAAGPVCTQLLADFGAEVIKVEAPAGDKARKWGSARFGEKRDQSSEYLALNRNKNSIVIDLKNPEGLSVVRDLIATGDVLVENYRPGVMDRLGLGYDAVAELNPRIVYCSISAFGQTGPLSRRPGFDLLMQAYAGHLSLTGEKGRPAVRIGPSSIDFLAGTHAALGISVALRERERSGRGQRIDTSLYEAAIQPISHMLVDYTGTGELSTRWGPYFPFLAPYGIFQASDREFYLGASTDQMWTRLAEAVGWQELLDDPRFRTNADRSRNQEALYDILVPRFKEKPASFWIHLAEELSIPNSLIHDLSEVVEQEQALAREAVVPIQGIDKVRSAGIPIKLSRTPGQIRKAPPSLGEDTRAILGRLGYSDERIGELAKAGAIGGA